jgi:GNAT superfamily N-acetyltransferase
MEIRPLDPFDDTDMHRFHDIGWRAEKDDGRAWNSFWTFDELATLVREPTGDRRMDCLCAWDGDRMVGAGFVEISLLANLDQAWLFAAVEPELRRRGIGGLLVQGMVDHARAHGRSTLLSATVVPFEERSTSGFLRFADRHGFRLANTEIMRVLTLPVKDGLLEEVRRESEPYHEGYSIETFVDDLPERYLASYSHLRNQLAVDAPTGDLEFEAERTTPEVMREKIERNKRAGRTTYFTLAVHDGEAVAHSDIAVPSTGTESHQGATLVRRDHRGHRLGMAVKVANLEALQRDRPDIATVHTQNAEDNPWMVSINERLGFEPIAVCPELLRHL